MDAVIQPKSGIHRFLDGWLLAARLALIVTGHLSGGCGVGVRVVVVWGGGGVSFPRGVDGCTSVHHPRTPSPLLRSLQSFSL